LKILTIEHTPFAYFADLGFYLLLVLVLPWLLMTYAPPQARLAVALAALFGMALWTLIEYAMHRYVFHGLEPFQSLHAAHHHRPQALIATPTWGSLALIAALVWLPATLLGGFWPGSGATLGVTAGYLAYGMIHHAVHHWATSNLWMRQLKHRHAVHHHNPRLYYGVTMLWWDHAFGSDGR
jgi:cyclopropane-fatty-acyl-phospholipid synthase